MRTARRAATMIVAVSALMFTASAVANASPQEESAGVVHDFMTSVGHTSFRLETTMEPYQHGTTVTVHVSKWDAETWRHVNVRSCTGKLDSKQHASLGCGAGHLEDAYVVMKQPDGRKFSFERDLN